MRVALTAAVLSIDAAFLFCDKYVADSTTLECKPRLGYSLEEDGRHKHNLVKFSHPDSEEARRSLEYLQQHM